MTWNAHLYLSIGIKAGHFKLLSEILDCSTSFECKVQMDPIKYEIIIKCSYPLDDGIYAYWKIHMSTHIKSLGMDVWQYIVT